MQIMAMLANSTINLHLLEALQQVQTVLLTLMAYSGAYATRLSNKCGRMRTNLTANVAYLVAKNEDPFCMPGRMGT